MPFYTFTLLHFDHDLYVCMSVYMPIIHKCMNTCIHIRLHMCMCTHAFVRACVHKWRWRSTFMNAYYVCVCEIYFQWNRVILHTDHSIIPHQGTNQGLRIPSSVGQDCGIICGYHTKEPF